MPDLAAAGVVPGLVAGVLAGLGVAVPLGPVGLLVARTGAVHGLRHGLAAGAGVAAVDTTYAVLAAVAGDRLGAALAGRERVVSLVAAVVLLAVAAHLLRDATRARPVDAAPVAPGSPLGVAGRFVLLTAVNPLTVLTFAALTAALPPGSAGIAFVAGVAGASAAWQSLLAVSGSLLGARSGPAASRWTGIVGSAAVGVAALVTLARAL